MNRKGRIFSAEFNDRIAIPAILNGRTIDSNPHTNRSAGGSLPKIPPERTCGERPLTKSTYPLKTSGSPFGFAL